MPIEGLEYETDQWDGLGRGARGRGTTAAAQAAAAKAKAVAAKAAAAKAKAKADEQVVVSRETVVTQKLKAAEAKPNIIAEILGKLYGFWVKALLRE